MVTAEEIKTRLIDKLQATHVDVVDTSGGCGQAYEVTIVSSVYAGKTPLAKHRLTNDACSDIIPQLHAFSQKTYTPEQWDKLHQK